MKKNEQIHQDGEILVSGYPKTRYSDKELLEFKEIILKKLKKAKDDLALLKESYSDVNPNGTNDTARSFKVLEEARKTVSREEAGKLLARQDRFIISLENALVRIENKTYGICVVTGDLIPKERLKIVPHATLSIGAKKEQDIRNQRRVFYRTI